MKAVDLKLAERLGLRVDTVTNPMTRSLELRARLRPIYEVDRSISEMGMRDARDPAVIVNHALKSMAMELNGATIVHLLNEDWTLPVDATDLHQLECVERAAVKLMEWVDKQRKGGR